MVLQFRSSKSWLHDMILSFREWTKNTYNCQISHPVTKLISSPIPETQQAESYHANEKPDGGLSKKDKKHTNTFHTSYK